MREFDIEKPIQWMLHGPAWIRYNVLINLLDRKREDPQVISAYNKMLIDPKIISLLTDMQNWEHVLLKRHNNASHTIHKLSFLADIGISPQEPDLKSTIKNILKHRSEEGPFQVLSNYPTNFGGSGVDEWLWCLCDAPLTIYILIKFGLGNFNWGINEQDFSIANLSWHTRVNNTLVEDYSFDKLGFFH